MRHVSIVAEMTARDLLRRRTAVVLLALVPLAFYLARHEMVGQSIRFASIGLAWAVSTFAAFAGAAARGLDPQLRVAGYRPWQLLAGRLAGLFGIGLVLAAVYAAVVLVDRTLQRPAAVLLQLALAVLIAVPLGALIAALLPRELDAALVLVILAGVSFILDPERDAARLLPFWSLREVGTYAIDLTGTDQLHRGVLHGGLVALACTAATVVLTATRLRTRRHVLQQEVADARSAAADGAAR